MFGPGPSVLQEALAVGRHPLDRSTIAGLAELSALSILHVVTERRRSLHAERFELALVRDLTGKIALTGDETAPVVAVTVGDALDEIDLGLLATLDDAVIDIVIRLVDEPLRVI